MLRGSHTQEREGKRRKLKWIWLVYSLYKNEYRIFKLFETTIGKELKEIEEKNQGNETNRTIVPTY
jgi:hypothetical protein